MPLNKGLKMVSPKQIASEVLETIIEDNSEPYRIESFEQIGSMSKNLNLYYADSFVDCIKNNSFKGRLLDEDRDWEFRSGTLF